MSPALREGFPRAGSGVCAKRTPRGLKRSETAGVFPVRVDRFHRLQEPVRCGESSAAGGFPSVGDGRSRREPVLDEGFPTEVSGVWVPPLVDAHQKASRLASPAVH